MTQEGKQLLLRDLCARLPYGVKVRNVKMGFDIYDFNHNVKEIKTLIEEYSISPYLRPMSSMTEEERKEYESFIFTQHHEWDEHRTSTQYVETDDVERYVAWLNEHHLDWRGLIPMDLALEAKEGMYKTE